MNGRQQLRQRILAALGDGGTMDMADRIITLVGVLTSEHLERELLGLHEVAELMGVSTNTISMRAARPGMNFPAPIVTLVATRIWSREQIEEWMLGNRRRVTPDSAWSKEQAERLAKERERKERRNARRRQVRQNAAKEG
jgi:predicted DNA-binding transcriptional regulator AlpA